MHRKKQIMLGAIGSMLMMAILAGCATATAEPPEGEPPTSAPDVAPPEPELTGDLVRGGAMYDKWWVVIEAEKPAGEHPLWATQSTNERSGDTTWRCKECHGWDYKGADGAYGSGSHFTGFPGVFSLSGSSASEILEMMKGSTNPDHDFSGVMSEQDLVDMSLFISQGLIDTADFIGADKTAIGDAHEGEHHWDEVCTLCHGPEGVAINFHDPEDPEYVRTVAVDNPWEFLHKVRFGQPGWPMPSSVTNEWSTEEVANVLAYAQTLPEDATLPFGGQLYDKWWEVLELDEPTNDQPLWATQSTNDLSGKDTW
ncbi:MAG: c-type cytochrome, partial [Anaerolineales bacterium]